MRSIDVLGREHRLLESMVVVLEAAAARLAAGGGIPSDLLSELVASFAYHVDHNHVVKEEQVLFPALEKHGVHRNSAVVTALSAQHEAGRVYRRDLAVLCTRMRDGDATAPRSFAGLAREYCSLLREHMRIEDAYFYTLAEGAISHQADSELCDRFRWVDEASGAAVRARETRRVLTDCQAALGLPAEALSA